MGGVQDQDTLIEQSPNTTLIEHSLEAYSWFFYRIFQICLHLYIQ